MACHLKKFLYFQFHQFNPPIDTCFSQFVYSHIFKFFSRDIGLDGFQLNASTSTQLHIIACPSFLFCFALFSFISLLVVTTNAQKENSRNTQDSPFEIVIPLWFFVCLFLYLFFFLIFTLKALFILIALAQL
jgi:quinol-cytochrome oxidoreductase complex cytochrome b subunit